MTSNPDDDPNRAFEFPPLEQSGPPAEPYAPVDYPSTYQPPPQSYPQSYPQPYPPSYPSAFPPPYQPYGAGPYDQYRLGAPQGTNGQAIGALVAGILGVPLCFCYVPSIVAIVLGILAMNETKRTGQDGHGMALAGVILGAISIALGAIFMIIGAVTPDTTTTN